MSLLFKKMCDIFLGWLDDMPATVKAVVLMEPHDNDLVMAMEKLKNEEVIDNWEYQKWLYENKLLNQSGAYSGNWNHYMAGDARTYKDENGKSYSTGIFYSGGNVYRTESISVKTTETSRDGGQKTAANGNKFYSWELVDSINLDFQAEVGKEFKSDWDIGSEELKNVGYNHNENTWGAGNGADK